MYHMSSTLARRYKRALKLIDQGIEIKKACKQSRISPMTFVVIARQLNQEKLDKGYANG